MKAVFVFCEGNHDITFVVRSLGQVAGATWVSDPIGKLPSPLGPVSDPASPAKPKVESIISKRYSNRTLDDLQLKAAAHAPPPSFEAIIKTNDTIYVLIRCHGDGAAKSAIDLIEDVYSLLNPAYGTDVKEIAAAFLFDADESLSDREAAFGVEYIGILSGVAAPKHSEWVKGSILIGLYVFHDQIGQKGTLDELIAPLIEAEWKARWDGANLYLNTHLQAADPVNAKRSEWLKAQINVTGQFLFPGDPMSVVIGKPRGNRPGLPDVHFVGAESQSLVRFLRAVPW